MTALRPIMRTLSAALILLGSVLIVASLGLYAYAGHERSAVESRHQAGEPAPVPPEAFEAPSVVVEAPSTATAAEEGTAQPPVEVAPPTPEATAPVSSSQPASRPAARWIRIPGIKVDSPVVEAPLKNGEWEVPKFVAGHLEGTANPGESGNVVLTGHVESISSGNVFARIGELAVGDYIFLYAGTGLIPYQVERKLIVKNDDLSVVRPTLTPVLSLITCTGIWNPLTRDYSERLVVVAAPVDLAESDR